jgi:predicted MFS family arabinose efflux permease
MIVAGAAALCVPIIAFVMREHPADVDLPPLGGTLTTAPVSRTNPALTVVIVLRDGAQSRDFWLLFATFFICGASTNGLIGTHLIPAAHDHEIPEVRAAGLLALMGLFDLVGTTGSGWLTDRWSSHGLLAWYYTLRGLSLMFLPVALAGTRISLLVFAIWYGLDWLATVPPTVKLANDAFGTARGPIMFGWIIAGHQLGAGLTAFAAGWIRVHFGDYQLAFWSSGALCLVAAGLSLAVGRRGREIQALPALGEAVPF